MLKPLGFKCKKLLLPEFLGAALPSRHCKHKLLNRLYFWYLQKNNKKKHKITRMSNNKTFTMIKPDAVANGHIGAILDHIIKGGFKIKAMKYIALSKEKAGQFYEVHKERPFYGELVDFMSSGPIVAAILEKILESLSAPPTLRKPKQVPSVICMRNPLVQMPFMDRIRMKMPKLKGIFSSQASKNFDVFAKVVEKLTNIAACRIFFFGFTKRSNYFYKIKTICNLY